MDPSKQLFVAAAVFLATHFVTSTPLRPALVKAIGEKAYLGGYILASFATIGWMAWAYGKAPAEPLWPGLRLLPALLMPLSFMLIACGVLSKNPTAVGAAGLLKSAEPARGIIRITRHPVMWGLMLWSGAHLLARGEFHATVFFGTFLVLAALGALLIDARKRKTLGEDWQRFERSTSYFPFLAIVQDRNRLDASEIGWRNPLIGLALYAVVFLAHAWLFGVRPY